MSDSERRPAGQPGRYQRSVVGLVGAMIITLVVVAGFVLLRNALREETQTPVRAVDPAVWVERGESDDQLHMIEPPQIDASWMITSANYLGGDSPVWRVGILTDREDFVGMVESTRSLESLLDEYIPATTSEDENIELAGRQWRRYVSAGRDEALVLDLESPQQKKERLVIYGDAGRGTLERFAAALDISDSQP